MSVTRSRILKWLCLSLVLTPAILLSSRELPANDADPFFVAGPFTCIEDLRGLSGCRLGQLFEQAGVGDIPVGRMRGHVLVMTDRCLPRVKTRMANRVWKGKNFCCDGSFVNQWPGFEALHSHAVIDTSWCDGRPAIVMEYPPNTPLFANMRDELRQIGPGLYLGAFFEREPCPKLRGFFALEAKPCGCPRCRHR